MFGSLLEQRLIRDPGWNAWANGDDFPNSGNTASGQFVTRDTALGLLAVYGSVTFIAEVGSELPVDQFRKNADGTNVAIASPAWLLQPNPETDIQAFLGMFFTSLLTGGNFYGAPVIDSVGSVREMWALPPQLVNRVRERRGGPIVTYIDGVRYTGPLVHVRGLTLPGEIEGMNPISYARHAIGSGLSMQDYNASFFSNGSAPSIVIEAPGGPETLDAAKLRSEWEKMHKGLRKAHGVAVLTGGAHANALTVSQKDAQFLESMNFTGAEIVANLYHLPPDVLGYGIAGSSLTYQNVAERWTEILRRVGPWLTRFERMATALSPRPQYTKLNRSAYLRADLTARYASYAVGIGSKFLTPNEARAYEDLPPLPDGDEFTEPAAPPALPDGNEDDNLE